MDSAFEIIVIILSVTLFILLVINILIGVLIVKLVKTLRAVAEKGGHLVETADEIGANLKQKAGYAGFFGMLTKFIISINKARKGK